MIPRISVVIPAFNNADYLDATVVSVLDQTFADFELIIADHASSDGTWAVMERHADDPRVSLLRTEAGGGAKRNWDRVSHAATGEYLKLVCGDDLLQPDILEKQLAALESAPSAVMAASKRDIVDARGDVVIRGRGLGGMRGVVPGATALRKTVVSGTNVFGEPASVLFRREALDAAGWWDDRYPYLIDEATYANVLRHGDFVAVDESLAAFRLSDTQWSVRLIRSQSVQAAEFHRAVHAESPDVVSLSDVRVGNLRAALAAQARRLIYLRLGRRMRPSTR